MRSASESSGTAARARPTRSKLLAGVGILAAYEHAIRLLTDEEFNEFTNYMLFNSTRPERPNSTCRMKQRRHQQLADRFGNQPARVFAAVDQQQHDHRVEHEPTNVARTAKAARMPVALKIKVMTKSTCCARPRGRC
jgi:hypothetical protein